MSWSEKYKKSIDCSSPKGFSQKAHCQGRKKRNENNMELSELKEMVRQIVNEVGPSRGFNKLASIYQKEAIKHQDMVKDQKKLAASFVAEKDPKKKEKTKKEILNHHKKVKAQEKKMKEAEYHMMNALNKEKIELEESVNEAKRSVVHKAVKGGSFPVTLVVIKNGKVIDQELVNTPMEVPAAFNVIQSKHKGAIVHIEDKTGKKLFSENLNEAYIVTFSKKKGEKPASAAFQSKDIAKSFEKDLKKDGYITMITQKKVKGIDESVNEAQKINPTSKKFLKGMKKIKVKGLGGYMPGVDYVYVDGDKYYFVDFEGDHMELKNISTIKQLHKLHGKSLGESVNEGKEPEIITQLRDVMKSGYKTLKDPKSGKRMKVDSYSASAIVGVYDKLKPSTQEKFVNQGLMGMQSFAFKVLR